MDSLRTDRLVLHPLSPTEAEHVVAGDPGDAGGWGPGYPTEGDVVAARRFLEVCADTGDPRPFSNYEIRVAGLAVGGAGFLGGPDEDGGVTIGYGLAPAARGQGYATEAVRALLEFARSQGVRRVRADTDHDNTASQHVLTRAGLALVAEDAELKHYRIELS
jgi:RimJ/RimL family protein N-acetyltransferase